MQVYHLQEKLQVLCFVTLSLWQDERSSLAAPFLVLLLGRKSLWVTYYVAVMIAGLPAQVAEKCTSIHLGDSYKACQSYPFICSIHTITLEVVSTNDHTRYKI
jgi:hypothetical protein